MSASLAQPRPIGRTACANLSPLTVVRCEARRQIGRRASDNSYRGGYCDRSIENSLHWQLDVSFGEDQSRTRLDHAQANLGVLRRMSLSLLKNETSSKVGIKE